MVRGWGVAQLDDLDDFGWVQICSNDELDDFGWFRVTFWEISYLSLSCQINILSHLFLKQPASLFSWAAGDAGSRSKYTCHPLLRQHTFLTIEMWRSGPTNLVMVHTNSFELLLYIHHPSQELLRTSATAHANSFGETQCVPHPRCTRSDGSLWQTLGRPICCALSKSEGPPQPSLTYQFNISTICAYAKMYVYTYTT